jgi:hypothetical protein
LGNYAYSTGVHTDVYIDRQVVDRRGLLNLTFLMKRFEKFSNIISLSRSAYAYPSANLLSISLILKIGFSNTGRSVLSDRNGDGGDGGGGGDGGDISGEGGKEDSGDALTGGEHSESLCRKRKI